jgi:hypothetical protein
MQPAASSELEGLVVTLQQDDPGCEILGQMVAIDVVGRAESGRFECRIKSFLKRVRGGGGQGVESAGNPAARHARRKCRDSRVQRSFVCFLCFSWPAPERSDCDLN